jgi:hypothetical protein
MSCAYIAVREPPRCANSSQVMSACLISTRLEPINQETNEMSVVGQSRRSGCVPVTSGLPPTPEMALHCASFGPQIRSAGQRFIASFGNILPGTDADGASPTS